MEEIISILTDGLIELRRSTSLNTDDIAKINAVLEELQSNQLSSQEIEKLVIILGSFTGKYSLYRFILFIKKAIFLPKILIV